jgi:hypothetical protein
MILHDFKLITYMSLSIFFLIYLTNIYRSATVTTNHRLTVNGTSNRNENRLDRLNGNNFDDNLYEPTLTIVHSRKTGGWIFPEITFDRKKDR